MPQNQRARLNWLDRVVLVAAIVVAGAAVLCWQQSVALKREVVRGQVEIRTSRAITCAGQRTVTGSTVPACQSVANLMQGR